MGNPRTWTSLAIECIIFATNVMLLLRLAHDTRPQQLMTAHHHFNLCNHLIFVHHISDDDNSKTRASETFADK